MQKKHQTVAQGGWGNDYSTVEGEAVSRLNLKWKAFHIRFLRKIPFHTYTNKSVPCSIMSTVCVYPLRWLMSFASVSFFPQHFVHIRSWWVEISWYAIEVNVTVNANIRANARSGLLLPIPGMLIFFFHPVQRYWFQCILNSAACLTTCVAQIGNCFSTRS